jgi:hypothetical protein
VSKTKVRHARAFQRDLKRAFALEVWNAESRKFESTARRMTQRERENFEETPYTLPVDFHSWLPSLLASACRCRRQP